MGAIVVAAILAGTVYAIVARVTRRDENRVKAHKWDNLQIKSIRHEEDR
jgi:hypothetical protein